MLRPSHALAAVLFMSACPSLASQQELRVEVTLHQPGRAFRGVTTEVTELRFHGAAKDPVFRLFDMDGRVVQSWPSPIPGWGFGELVKPLPGGRLLCFLRDLDGPGKVLAEIAASGVVWIFDPKLLGMTLHHDFERLANGHTIVLAQLPRLVESIRPTPLLDDIILEIDHAGSVVWAWSTADNAASLPIPDTGWAYIAKTSQPVIFHTNSLQSLPHNRWESDDIRFRAGNLLVSQRDTNVVFVIDRLTGRIVWHFSGTVGQHHARMIPGELTGAGNILIYDNGGSAGVPPISRPYSRILELAPRTKQIVWAYPCFEGLEPGCRSFFSHFMGSAQRLPNGNTLVTESMNGRVFEVTRDGERVWEYLIANREQIYRAYRWAVDWSGSRELFPW